MAIVVIEGKAHPYVVAEVAPPEIVEKLCLGIIAVSATPAFAPIAETARPMRVFL